MTKAFLFDMDGVLADTEKMWDELGYDDLLIKYFGKDLASQVFVTSGMSLKAIHDEFVKLGWKKDYQDFHAANIKFADRIYAEVPITRDVDKLLHYLNDQLYIIGVVSSSPSKWIDDLTRRIKNNHLITYKLSVNVHPTLRPKPSPDPYLFAMKELHVTPQETIILEDSVTGVASGKACGATVICFQEYFHPENKWQSKPTNADYYASNMQEVQDIISSSQDSSVGRAAVS